MSDRDPDLVTLDRHVAQLMEHFDSVQIICTRFEAKAGKTSCASRGDGNWYARVGAVREWLIRDDQATREDVKGDDDG